MNAIILVTALVLGTARPADFGAGVVQQIYEAGSGAAGRGTAVLVPGLTGCAWGYRHVAGSLVDAGYRVVVVEPLGVGASARPAGADYSLTAQADRLATIVAGLGSEPAVMVAHGVSASMALRLACRRPDLVRAVISIEGGPDESCVTPAVERTLGLVSLAARLGAQRLIRDRFRAGLEAASGDGGWIDGIAVRRYFQGPGRDVGATVDALRAMAAATEPASLRENLPRIACPVLLLLGAAEHEGRPDPAAVAALRAGLPACEVREVPGVGHYIFEERPAVVVQAVLDAFAASRSRDEAQQPAALAAAVRTGGASCAQ